MAERDQGVRAFSRASLSVSLLRGRFVRASVDQTEARKILGF
jgi:hypothetical protein